MVIVGAIELEIGKMYVRKSVIFSGDRIKSDMTTTHVFENGSSNNSRLFYIGIGVELILTRA